jgi:cell division protein FtsL
MTKFIVFILIFFLIISTAIVKNSTKEVNNEIYTIRENLLFLENRFKDTKLEFDYLSSSEKLLEYQKLYFEKSLQIKSLDEIKILNIFNDELKINNLTITSKNE